MRLFDKLQGFVGKAVYQWNDYLGIYPTPTETKTLGIHYVKTPATITRNIDPEIADEYHEALVYYAVKEIAMRINPELAQLYDMRWKEALDKASEGSKKYYPERIKSTYRDY